MLKPILGLAATGVVAVLLWKVLVVLLLPLLGIAIGIAALVIKVLFVLFALTVAWWLYRRLSRDGATT